MPILQNAKRALRQSKRRKSRNLARKNAYKRLIKEINRLTEAGEKTQANEKLPQAFKAIDKAAKVGAIHSNKADRLKSRLSKKVST